MENNSKVILEEEEDDQLAQIQFCGSTLYKSNGFWLRLEYLEAIKQMSAHFKPLPTDIILASFPKTGTTWLKSILYSIINPSSRNYILVKNPHLLVPILEIQLYGTKAEPHDSFPGIISSSSTRIFSTHLSYQTLSAAIKGLSEPRVVYITRNPKDTLVSMWNFQQKAKTLTSPWPMEEAFNRFCNGTVPFGPYFDHVLGYRNESLERPSNVFFITYEELKHDCKNHVKRLAEFLGCPFEGEEDDAVLDEILSNCSFQKLSNYEINKSSEEYVTWLKFPSSSFYRKGEIGDHKNFLSAENIQRLDKITEEKFHASGFMYGV